MSEQVHRRKPTLPKPPASPAPPPPKGIECRDCGCRHFFAIDERNLSTGRVRRRSECRHCGALITIVA